MVIYDEVSLICDCGAEMEYRGIFYDPDVGEYNHACPRCGCREYHRDKYPLRKRKRYGKI